MNEDPIVVVTPVHMDFIVAKGPVSAHAGIIGRLGRILWFPVAYVLGLDFKL